jgi:hypothetical protein
MALWAVLFPVWLTFSGTPVAIKMKEPQNAVPRAGEVVKFMAGLGPAPMNVHAELGYYVTPDHVLGISGELGPTVSFTKNAVGLAVNQPSVNVYWQGFFGRSFFVRSYVGYVDAVRDFGTTVSEGKGFSFGCGIGNEWQIGRGFTIGGDWLSVHGLTMFNALQSKLVAQNDRIRSTTLEVKKVQTLASVGFVKLRLGWSF